MYKEELLKKYRILGLKYRPDLHTFEVNHSELNGVNLIHFLNKKNFPDLPSLNFLDEKVTPLEEVTVFLKEEGLLKLEGWKNLTKYTMTNPEASPFKIGKNKRTYLGKTLKGHIGITETFKPYFLTSDGYRFSESEIQLVIKTDLFPNKIDAKCGSFEYYSNTNELHLHDGDYVLDNDAIGDLIKTLRQARLI